MSLRDDLLEIADKLETKGDELHELASKLESIKSELHAIRGDIRTKADSIKE
jgi:hypothetical protein